MMDFLVGLYGRYPFAGEKYAQVEVEWIGGMENQTATSIGAFALTGDGTWESLVVHELAHSWFGNSLTPALWRDIWLSEGFARYTEALWVEHTSGLATYHEFMYSIGEGRWPDLFVGEELLGDPAPPVLAANKRLVYDKGAWLLHMLRGYLGDATFFALLRTYAGDAELRYGNTTTADLIAIASATAGEDLESFFRPWLETDAVPVLAVTSHVANDGDRSRVRVRVRQEQQPLFTLRLPVRIRTARETRDEVIELAAATAAGEWTVAGRHAEVEIDPESWVLHRRAEAPPPLLTLLSTMPNPATASAEPRLRWYLRDDAPMQVALFDVRGRRLGDWDLGIQTATGTAEDGDEPATWTVPLLAIEPRLAAGIYWLEVRAGGSRAFRSLTLLH
jgi:aminopeptidase N